MHSDRRCFDENANLVAARVGGSFRCCVCLKRHGKASIENPPVYRCFVRFCQATFPDLFGYPRRYNKKWFPAPIWSAKVSRVFRIGMEPQRFPLEERVYFLAFRDRSEASARLGEEVDRWKEDLTRKEAEMVEERGVLDLSKPMVEDSVLRINGERVVPDEEFCSFMMKSKEVGEALSLMADLTKWETVEWTSPKEPAKVLIFRKGLKFFVSRDLGVAQVPNGVKSIKEAEEFLRNPQRCV